MVRPNKNGNALQLDGIIDAAWRVVDREGIAGLSTRNVAAELGVKSPALYWHVKNKQELLSRMIERALRESMRAPPADLPWWEWLRAYSREQRRILLMHRDSGLIAATAPPTEQMRSDIMPQVLAPMLKAGLSREEAGELVGALASLVLGSAIYEQNDQTRAFATAYADPEATFEHGLESIIEGVRQRAKRRSEAVNLERVQDAATSS